MKCCALLLFIAISWAVSSSSATWFNGATGYQRSSRGTPLQGDVKSEMDSWCPTASRKAISPYCTCEGSLAFPVIKCSNLEDVIYLRRVLQTEFPISRFGSLLIANSSVDNLDANSLPKDKYFSMVTIKKTSLMTVDLESLMPSAGSLKRIEMVHNRLTKFPFGNLTAFKKLQNLDLYYNDLTNIPDYAFGTNLGLKSVDLSFNKISHIGSYAFADLPSLELLDLRFNQLKVVNNFAFASALLANRHLTLDLSNNKLFYMAEGAFESLVPKELLLSSNSLTKFPQQHFLPMLRAMEGFRFGSISIHGNRLQCNCQQTSWLVSLPASYRERVQGFTCSNLDNKKLIDLGLKDIGCY